MPVNPDHQFGSLSTDLKLSMVEGYLSAFTKALRSKFSSLWYIDAFAGTGVRTIKHEAVEANIWAAEIPERIERRRGSAQIAIDASPAFDHIVFIDLKKRHYGALCALRDQFPGRSIEVIRDEANAAILQLINGKSWAGRRAVMFLDPYGMHVNWPTLEAVAATRAIDVWYLVSLEGLFRQAPRDRTKLTDQKRQAIDRLLGPCDWEETWYADSRQGQTLFDDPRIQPNMRRTADVKDISAFVKKRLESVFGAVLRPVTLKNKNGAPAFLLFFAVSNRDGPAIGLATRIAGHMLKAGNSSQVRP